MNKYIRLFNTIKYLEFTQIYYRIFYFVRVRFRKISRFKYKFTKKSSSTALSLIDSCEYYSSYKDGEFTILNLSKKFDSKIDWNYSEYGKLWTYNLTYFEYLKEREDLSLIYDFIENICSVKDGLEPFPISLRGINWIKFLTKYKIKDKKIDDSLYAQYYILLDNLEYHLLGNHLLENGFSLLFGAYYFQDENLYKKAKEILEKELNEQILDDGAHFELSPMYHQLMLFRVLDCINLVQNNSWKNKELLNFLEEKASVMLGWLKSISYENGEIPLLNDSANCIAPISNELFKYANNLKLSIQHSKLSQSGYRKVKKQNYDCIVDIGEIGASYIAGHAHADTFNFVLYLNERPIIVDTGTSTYEVNEVRFYERSTAAHNTVVIAGKNFGLGSSREHAPLIIKMAGIDAIVAKSFARIFYRNAINVGLAAVICDVDDVEEADEVEVRMDEGVFVDITKGIEKRFSPLPLIMREILTEGGLDMYIRKYGELKV